VKFSVQKATIGQTAVANHSHKFFDLLSHFYLIISEIDHG